MIRAQATRKELPMTNKIKRTIAALGALAALALGGAAIAGATGGGSSDSNGSSGSAQPATAGSHHHGSHHKSKARDHAENSGGESSHDGDSSPKAEATG
jgi:hypothetical protein